jgi:hypothetical protein
MNALGEQHTNLPSSGATLPPSGVDGVGSQASLRKRAGLFFPDPAKVRLTPAAVRTIARRRKLMQEFDELVARGTSKRKAAALLGVSYASIWRWKRLRLVPQTYKCGRKSLLDYVDIPPKVLNRVRTLQMRGRSNVRAWRMVADEPGLGFPQGLREMLAYCEVPHVLLNLTRLRRRHIEVLSRKKVTVISGQGILEIVEAVK